MALKLTLMHAGLLATSSLAAPCSPSESSGYASSLLPTGQASLSSTCLHHPSSSDIPTFMSSPCTELNVTSPFTFTTLATIRTHGLSTSASPSTSIPCVATHCTMYPNSTYNTAPLANQTVSASDSHRVTASLSSVTSKMGVHARLSTLASSPPDAAAKPYAVLVPSGVIGGIRPTSTPPALEDPPVDWAGLHHSTLTPSSKPTSTLAEGPPREAVEAAEHGYYPSGYWLAPASGNYPGPVPAGAAPPPGAIWYPLPPPPGSRPSDETTSESRSGFSDHSSNAAPTTTSQSQEGQHSQTQTAETDVEGAVVVRVVQAVTAAESIEPVRVTIRTTVADNGYPTAMPAPPAPTAPPAPPAPPPSPEALPGVAQIPQRVTTIDGQEYALKSQAYRGPVSLKTIDGDVYELKRPGTTVIDGATYVLPGASAAAAPLASAAANAASAVAAPVSVVTMTLAAGAAPPAQADPPPRILVSAVANGFGGKAKIWRIVLPNGNNVQMSLAASTVATPVAAAPDAAAVPAAAPPAPAPAVVTQPATVPIEAMEKWSSGNGKRKQAKQMKARVRPRYAEVDLERAVRPRETCNPVDPDCQFLPTWQIKHPEWKNCWRRQFLDNNDDSDEDDCDESVFADLFD